VDYPIQYQWTLLQGINDSQDEMDGIIRLLRGKFAIMNLIPYNSLDDDQFQRPGADRIHQIMRYLHEHGVLTKVRNSAGQDIDGGCGQLRARAERVATERRRAAVRAPGPEPEALR
jgi:23S rRNA (adenine2503-C2)-methyltransferase